MNTDTQANKMMNLVTRIWKHTQNKPKRTGDDKYRLYVSLYLYKDTYDLWTTAS